MNKKLFVSMLAAGALTAMSMNACAGEITAEEILANYAAAEAAANGASCTATANIDGALNIPDYQTDLEAAGNMILDIAMTMDPIAVSASGTADVSVMGEGMGIDLGMYLVQEDAGLAAYVDVTTKEGEESDREVKKTIISEEETAQIMEAIASMQGQSFDISALPLTYALADETVDVNGTACYELTTSITSEDVSALLGYALEAAAQVAPEVAEQMPSEDELSMVASLLTGLQVNFIMDISTETYQAMHFQINMDGSDWTLVETLLASYMGLENEDGSLMETNLTVNSLYIDYVYDYSEVGEITVPEDVAAAAEEVALEDVQNLAASELSGVEEEVETE